MWSRSIELDWPRRVVLLEALVAADAEDPWLVELAASWRSGASPRVFAARLQSWFQDEVRWVPDSKFGALEVFRGPWLVLESREGDCDCQARAVAAILRAGGVASGLRYLVDDDGSPLHVFPVVLLGGDVVALETTIHAELGEHPDRALARTGG